MTRHRTSANIATLLVIGTAIASCGDQGTAGSSTSVAHSGASAAMPMGPWQGAVPDVAYTRDNISSVVKMAEQVIIGKVVKSMPVEAKYGSPRTGYEIEVRDTLKGAPALSSRVVVIQEGGIGNSGQNQYLSGESELDDDSSYILFSRGSERLLLAGFPAIRIDGPESESAPIIDAVRTAAKS